MPTGFDDYVVARGPALLRFAYVLTGDRHLAEDLVQEVLAKASRRWSRIEAADQPDGYVKRSIVNQYLSWRRRRSATERVVADVPDGYRANSYADSHADRDLLWRRLAALPRQQRAVLVLRFYEDLDDLRIAELIGCAPATVRAHASRGLAAMRSDRSWTYSHGGAR